MRSINISVVIPVKNGFPEIKHCIDGILMQTILPKKIVVIDSGSEDNTIHYLREIPLVQIVQIPSQEFNHGETRNLGLNFVDSEFVYFTVQDAKASDKHLFENLLEPFLDESVAGVCGKQIVEHTTETNPVEWYRPQTNNKIKKFKFESEISFNNASPKEKNEACSWDDVNAMYRVSVLKKIRFKKVVFGEDMLWAKDAYCNGFSLVYQESAHVYHYHLENPQYTFKRSFTTQYFRFVNFNFIYDTPQMTLKDHFKILRTIFISLGFKPYSIAQWYFYNFRQFKATLKAYNFFNEKLSAGIKDLHLSHEKLCSQAPSPLKRFL